MNVEAAKFRPVSNEQVAVLGTQPIPVGPYHDPDYFALEREAVFKRAWLHIGHVSELPEPGSFIVRKVEAARASILIVRGKDDVIRAFYNVCTHRGTELVAQSDGLASAFSCRYHMWTFNDHGELRGAPDFERFFLDKADCGLSKVAVDVAAGLIFINLTPDPEQTLSEFLSPLETQLEQLPCATATTFAEYLYEIDANWKLVYDNFQENYHLRFIHPRSVGTTATGPENPFGYATGFDFVGLHRKQALWMNPEHQPGPVQVSALERLVNDAMSGGYDELLANSEYFAVFPNFFMLNSPILPFSHTVFPIGPEKSRGVIRFYWRGEDDSATQRFAREYAVAATRDVHAEDRGVIEAGQRGISSGAIQHIHFQAQEALCRHFINSVDATVQAYKAEKSLGGFGA